MPYSPSRSRVALVVAVGVALRLLLVQAAPRWGYAWDHFDTIGMGLAAEQHGLLQVYSIARSEVPAVRGRVVRGGEVVSIERQAPRLPNYPPLAMLLLWLEARGLSWLWTPLEVNSFGARLVHAVAPGIGEFLTVLGVALLARALAASRRAAWYAAAVCWLFPPLLMNTWLWGQSDALVLAPAVAAVTCMVRGRWMAAGLCVALAALVKPQGALLAVVAAFAAAAGTGLRTAVTRLATMLGAAVAATLVLTAPWLATDGIAWIERSYLATAGMFPYTTLEAFNVWYLDALIRGGPRVARVLDSTAGVGALSRDVWGALLLLGAVVGSAALCWRGQRTRPAEATVLFAALWLWSAFVWPTRVHERYMLYCVPFVIALAAVRPRLWPSVVGLAVVGTAEHSWNVWHQAPHPTAEWLLTLTSLAAYAWAVAVARQASGERA